jgi:hypothetical protein
LSFIPKNNGFLAIFFLFYPQGEEKKRDPKTFTERWKLGEGGIQLDEINLIGLLQISRGTWLPILQLARHIIPRWDWLQDSQEKRSGESEED